MLISEKWLVFRGSAVLQGHCFDHILDPFGLENHAKYQVNPLRNGGDIVNKNMCTGWWWSWRGGIK